MQDAILDTTTLPIAELLPVQTTDPAAIFGSAAVSACPAVIFDKAEPILRTNVFGFTFGLVAAWLLFFAFVVFLCLLQRKKISAVMYYHFNFKKFLKVQSSQQWMTNFAFACFAFFALVLLIANMWHFSFADTGLSFCFIVSLGALVVYFLSKYFVCSAIQLITQQRMFLFNLLSANIYTFFAMCFLLIPLFFAQTLVVPPYYEPLMYVQAGIVGVCLLYYFIRTFIVFVYEKISVFFWLLYVSVVEVLPLAVVYKLILQS